jgi:hypothetical protein
LPVGRARVSIAPCPSSPADDQTTRTALRDAGSFILTLPPAEADRDHWQLAMKCLIDAAERGGILILAEIAVKQALHHGEPDAPPKQRRKAVKRFRVIR